MCCCECSRKGRREEEEGGGGRRREEEGGGGRRKEEEGGGKRRREKEGGGRRRREEERGGGRKREEEGGRGRRKWEGEQGVRREVNFCDQENIKLTDQKVAKCLSQDLVKERLCGVGYVAKEVHNKEILTTAVVHQGKENTAK